MKTSLEHGETTAGRGRSRRGLRSRGLATATVALLLAAGASVVVAGPAHADTSGCEPAPPIDPRPVPTRVTLDTVASTTEDGCPTPHFDQSIGADRSAYVVGDSITYTIEVRNDGELAGAISFESVVPATVAVASVVAVCEESANCTSAASANRVTGSATLEPDMSAKFVIEGTTVAPGSATNSVTVTPDPSDAVCSVADNPCGGGVASTPELLVAEPEPAIDPGDPTSPGEGGSTGGPVVNDNAALAMDKLANTGATSGLEFAGLGALVLGAGIVVLFLTRRAGRTT